MTIGGALEWYNSPNAVLSGTLPNNLFTFAGNQVTHWFEGVDLSALGSGKTIVGSTSRSNAVATFKECKLGSSVTIAVNDTTSYNANEIRVIRCDSGDTNYRTEKYNYTGTQTTETTIVRTGGASDGTTPIAWKLVTTANAKTEFPLEAFPIVVWNETTGSSVTVTVEGIWGGGAVPTNDQIWIDIEYLGTSGFPIVSKATSGLATPLSTPANIPAGSGTWGGSTTKFAMSVTTTPQEKGPITIYPRVGKASDTFYIDPRAVIT
jgi:hypothetical protein